MKPLEIAIIIVGALAVIGAIVLMVINAPIETFGLVVVAAIILFYTLKNQRKKPN